jgi:hypothetical protein
MRNIIIPDISKMSAVFSHYKCLYSPLPNCKFGRTKNGCDGLFADWQGLPALQAGASLETCFYFRRRLEPAPSGGV